MTITIGWITPEFPARPSRRSVWLKSGAMLTMRTRNMMLALRKHGIHSQFYRSGDIVDAVMIIKTFHPAALEEVKRLKKRGIPIIFDANVNYYYIWGNYIDLRTQPTPELQRTATEMTLLADFVIADSEYLADVVRDFRQPKDVVWVPDNVLPLLFRPNNRPRQTKGQLRLIWSGIDFKADELLMIQEPLAAVEGVELWLISNGRPPILDTLAKQIPVRWFRYHDFTYGWFLGRADAIISPRQLNNGYNLGHTEYKISLGMARNLPAIVSPQPSYVRALSNGGGIICDTLSDWKHALHLLCHDPAQRIAMGDQARQTVEKNYLTPVVAKKLANIVKKVARG